MVSLLVRPTNQPPIFLPMSPAGHYKSKNPTVPTEVLERRWVPGTNIVYIGKAGGYHQLSTLRTRLQHYVNAGGNPEAVESALLAQFEFVHGRLPFANLKHGASAKSLCNAQPHP